jgi:hypothetical protein
MTLIPVCIRGFVRCLYAYGDISVTNRMHNEIVSIWEIKYCIPICKIMHRRIAVRIWGSPYAYGHRQLGLSLAFPPFDVGGRILVSTKGPACKLYKMELVLSSLPKFSSMDTAPPKDPPLLILSRMSTYRKGRGLRRRGEPSSAKFEIHMYLGIFFWRQAAL